MKPRQPPTTTGAASERRFGRRTTDRLNRTSDLEEADAGREGARLVALETRRRTPARQVATYLREPFALDEASAALAVAEPVTP